MTIRTGKGGRYRYYSCNNRITKGSSACQGLSIRMEQLDEIVVNELETRISRPDRIKALLAGLIERQRNGAKSRRTGARNCANSCGRTESKIGRVLDAIQEGLAQETDLVRDRLAKLEQERDEVLRLIASLDRRQTVPATLLSERNVRAFGRVFRDRLHSRRIARSESLHPRTRRQDRSRPEGNQDFWRRSCPGNQRHCCHKQGRRGTAVPSFVQGLVGPGGLEPPTRPL